MLLAEGSTGFRQTAGDVLRRECFELEEVSDGQAALDAASRGGFDLVLLDLDLRSVAGMDVLRRLRALSTVPVIALSGRDSETAAVLALELGADDCLPVPCSPASLVSHVRALLRRCEYERAGRRGPVREVGGIRLDLALREVVVDERIVYLTEAQFKVLALLAEEPGRVLSRREILHHLWRSPRIADEHVCDVHISNIRAKIERDPRRPQRIVTIRGLGYKLVAA